MITTKTRGRSSLFSLTFPACLLLLGSLVALVHHKHDFVWFEQVEAFASPSFRFPISSFLDGKTQTQAQAQMKTQMRSQSKTRLCSTSASAAYLESISYRSPSFEDGLLGATSNYLDALSSVSNQLHNANGGNQYSDYYYSQAAYVNEGGGATTSEGTTAQVQATVEASSHYPPPHVPFSEDLLINEVVQRVTQEFSSALEAFGGETYDSFVDSTSTLVADSMPAYIWDLEEVSDKGRKGSRAFKDTIQQGIDSSSSSINGAKSTTPPEETLRELTSKLDNTFRSFKENLSSSTHSVTRSFGGSVRSQASQPNAAVTAAKQQENMVSAKQLLDGGALTPEALSTNAIELEKQASAASAATTSAFSKSLLETASTVEATFGGVTSKASGILVESQQGFQKSIGSLMTNTNQGIEKALSTVSKSTTAVTSSLAETTNAATSSIYETGSALTSGAASGVQGSVGAVGSATQAAGAALASGASGVQSSVGAALDSATNAATSSPMGSALASGASSAASNVHGSVGAVGSATKAAGAALASGASGVQSSVGAVLGSATKAVAVTIEPAVALSASQGFGLPGNAYAGGGDVAGMIEMTVATILSIPRALMDATMMEINPNLSVDDLMEKIAGSLTSDVLVPLSEPLRALASEGTVVSAKAATMAMSNTAAAGATPLDQAQAVLKTLQMVLALVVGIPRAALEGLSGLTIQEIQVVISQADVRALSEELTGFASAVSTVLLSLLKVVAQAISVIVTQSGIGDTMVSGQEELVSKLVSFVLEDLLPTILDGLFLILQQFALLLLEGSSYIVGTL